MFVVRIRHGVAVTQESKKTNRHRAWARHVVPCFGLTGVLAGLISCGGSGSAMGGNTVLTTKAQVGKALFFDKTLSNPKGMSCASCHATASAFTDPRHTATSQGVVLGLFGFRQAPSVCYMAYSPTFQLSGGEGGTAIGGQFWDGRATDLQAQAKLPFVNPIEMNNASLAEVVNTVKNGPEAAALKRIYGPNIFKDTTTAINAIVDALAAFEKSPEVSPFSSKYDAYLSGKTILTASEIRGLVLFNGKAGCGGCHPSSPSPDGTPPLFTNFCYENLGLPKNPNNPYYTIPSKFNPQGSSFIDIGLLGTTGRASDAGQFKTPTLRNVALTAPYFHNGIFTSLDKVVDFYNARDLGGFDPPEVPATENMTELGNLKLTAQESADIVAFLNTLTDGYK